MIPAGHQMYAARLPMASAGGGAPRDGEENVAAVEQGGDVHVTQALDQTAEIGHRDVLGSSDVDAANQRDVPAPRLRSGQAAHRSGYAWVRSLARGRSATAFSNPIARCSAAERPTRVRPSAVDLIGTNG